MTRPKRVCVVGTSGSGKTVLASRLADVLSVRHIELDSLYHLPNWQPRAEDEMLALLERLLASDGWVVDGNYRRYTLDGPVWERADTVIWLDLPRWQVMTQVLLRTIRRGLLREELWNGNREQLSSMFKREPLDNIVLWSWTTYHKNRDRYLAAVSDPRFAHLTFTRLRSRKAMDLYLRGLTE